jgi:hypothetical protein
MNICHKCKKEIRIDRRPGRGEQCPFCGTDLRCCLNCVFYEQGVYNDCREPQAERVLDKTRSNFCDFFQFRRKAGNNLEKEKQDNRNKLEALFKN